MLTLKNTTHRKLPQKCNCCKGIRTFYGQEKLGAFLKWNLHFLKFSLSCQEAFNPGMAQVAPTLHDEWPNDNSPNLSELHGDECCSSCAALALVSSFRL